MTTYRQFLEAKAAVAPATAGGRHHMLITRQDADLANTPTETPEEQA